MTTIGPTDGTPPVAPPTGKPPVLTPEQKKALEQAGKILGWSLEKMEALYNSMGAYADKIILHLDFVDQFVNAITDYGKAFTAIFEGGGHDLAKITENVEKMIEAVYTLRELPDKMVEEAMKNAPEDPDALEAYIEEVNQWKAEMQNWLDDLQAANSAIWQSEGRPELQIIGYLLAVGLYKNVNFTEKDVETVAARLQKAAKIYREDDKVYDIVQRVLSSLNYANADASSTSQLLSSKLQKIQGDLAALLEKMSETTEKIYQTIISMLRNVGIN